MYFSIIAWVPFVGSACTLWSRAQVIPFCPSVIFQTAFVFGAAFQYSVFVRLTRRSIAFYVYSRNPGSAMLNCYLAGTLLVPVAHFPCWWCCTPYVCFRDCSPSFVVSRFLFDSVPHPSISLNIHSFMIALLACTLELYVIEWVLYVPAGIMIILNRNMSIRHVN